MTLAETLEKLIELQALDSGCDQVEKHRQALVDKLDLEAARIAALKAQAQEEKRAAEDLAKRRKALEIEIGSQETRLKRYQGQLDEVQNAKEYEALKLEIDKLKEEKVRHEEKVLEILFQEDVQKEKSANLAGQIQADEEQAARDKREADREIADCEKAAAEKKAERKVRLAALPEDEARGYEALRGRGKRIAVAPVLDNDTCGGCHMAVPPQLLMEVKNARQLNRCDCGRYLYLPGR